LKPFFLSIVAVVAVLAISGCASTQDLRRARSEMDLRIAALEEKNKSQEQVVQAMKAENAALMEKYKETVGTLQKGQAEAGTDITEIKDHIQQLRGMVEGLKKDTAGLKELREKVDSVSFKVNFLENFLGIGKKEDAADDKNNRGGATKGAQRGKTEKDLAYEAAYASFKEGKYEKARGEFQAYLKQHPGSEYAGNAQFWIGECYYSERKYEKAIIEYEKVVKNYPEGNKVSNALLKQGLSFQKLGDKSSARLILQQVIKDYPNTNQARIARAKLTEIK